jgi:hypothetical protein
MDLELDLNHDINATLEGIDYPVTNPGWTMPTLSKAAYMLFAAGPLQYLLIYYIRVLWRAKETGFASAIGVFDPIFRSKKHNYFRVLYFLAHICLFSLICLTPFFLVPCIRFYARFLHSKRLQRWILNSAFLITETVVPFFAYSSIHELSQFCVGMASLTLVGPEDEEEAVNTMKHIEEDIARRKGWYAMFDGVPELIASTVFPVIILQAILRLTSYPYPAYASVLQLFQNNQLADDFNQSKTPMWVRDFHRNFTICNNTENIVITPYAEAHPWLSQV